MLKKVYNLLSEGQEKQDRLDECKRTYEETHDLSTYIM